MDTTNLLEVIIDGTVVKVPDGVSIFYAAKQAGIRLPSLCHHPELRPEGNCRVCCVEVEGMRNLAAACVYPVQAGMVIHTHSERVLKARRLVVELLLANHPSDCLACGRNLRCELQVIAAELGIRQVRFQGEKRAGTLDLGNAALERDPAKCILCGRCIRACSERQGLHVYSFAKRGFQTMVAPAFDQTLDRVACTYCGQCATVCPTAAIQIKDDTAAVWQAIHNPQKHVVVQTAPAVRVALAEALGLDLAGDVTGKMVAALRRLGFDRVFDTNFSADLTIMEEGAELVARIEGQGPLPMLTSCSPGWVNFAELLYPELLPHLSTAKSPQQMFGAVVKTYYAEMSGIDAADIVSVSIMPCTAKKAEAARPEFAASGYRDVDYVLTTVELAAMIRQASLDFAALPEEEYDAPLGLSSGAGRLFGTTGGVMEAALRTVYEQVTGEELPGLVFAPVRGMQGLKEAEVRLGDRVVRLAVAHSLSKARWVMEELKRGTLAYDFVEVMACPGGCIGGGGQPSSTPEGKLRRQNALYAIDEAAVIRKSHENPAIQELYAKWLGKPLGEKAHHLLHTHYQPQCRR